MPTGELHPDPEYLESWDTAYPWRFFFNNGGYQRVPWVGMVQYGSIWINETNKNRKNSNRKSRLQFRNELFSVFEISGMVVVRRMQIQPLRHLTTKYIHQYSLVDIFWWSTKINRKETLPVPWVLESVATPSLTTIFECPNVWILPNKTRQCLMARSMARMWTFCKI